MRIGFVGLGNVGGKLAGSVLRNGYSLTVHDLDRDAAAGLLELGAEWAGDSEELTANSDVVITCLPSPAASASVLESAGGLSICRQVKSGPR